MKRIGVIVILIGFFGWLGITGIANTGNGYIDHSAWNNLLQKYVSKDGVVNYKGLMSEKAVLEFYIKMLGSNLPEKASGDNEILAYWINLYNAATVSLILDNYPLKTIRDIGDPWDLVFVKVGEIQYSLNDIEHNIIRKDFNEPRIHFALVCAAKSCPSLLSQSYSADKLESQLQMQGVKFINNQNKNEITETKIKISKLFEWYQDDFTKEGSLIDFLNGFSNVKISEKATMDFMDYSWSLNE